MPVLELESACFVERPASFILAYDVEREKACTALPCPSLDVFEQGRADALAIANGGYFGEMRIAFAREKIIVPRDERKTEPFVTPLGNYDKIAWLRVIEGGRESAFGSRDDFGARAPRRSRISESNGQADYERGIFRSCEANG